MDLKVLAEKEIDGIIKKIDKNMRLYRDGLPTISTTLKYSENLSADGNWTGSFWLGMVLLARLLTKDEKYSDYFASFKPLYQKRLDKGYKDHDLGFLYQLYAVNGYRMTGDVDYMKMAGEAAQHLYCRYNQRGGYIRAWCPLFDYWVDGKTIIDCLMNLPLLFCATNMGFSDKYAQAAKQHAYAALNNVREDGSTYHTFNFNPITGEPIKGENEGGYSDESCWSRGQSWAVYGFSLAYLHTGCKEFLDAAIKCADYFIANTPKGTVPLWDFKLDDKTDTNVDTSAAAIACCGLYTIAEITGDKQHYVEAADDMLSTLIKNHSRVFDNESEALMDCGYTGAIENGKRIVNQSGTIFGDYFYMEALVRRTGRSVRIWDL